jgi:hypothetical protein
MTNQLLQFTGQELVPVATTLDTKLAVADSWLVEDGRSRSLNAHLDRFRSWSHQVHPEASPHIDSFFNATLNQIPIEGRWFPRIELHTDKTGATSLHLRLREAPEQLGSATLWTYPEADPRENPAVKGPDLSIGMQLRRRANMLGADEAVIVDASGYICEGALSALVWWRGDVLCAPNDETPWLSSITRADVFAIAEQMGLGTRVERVKPADLVETEVWLLSSLQAIRPVTNWLELGGPLATPSHVEAFNKRLRLLATSIL